MVIATVDIVEDMTLDMVLVMVTLLVETMDMVEDMELLAVHQHTESVLVYLRVHVILGRIWWW